MKHKQSKKELLKRLETSGKKLATVNVAEGIAAMLAFYEEQRAEGCEIDEDGDMLLYQWGVYNFEKPATFQLDLTRQFSVPDEDEPYQLSLTFHFEPSAGLKKIKDANQWCNSPDELAEFRTFIEKSPAYRAALTEKVKKVELDFFGC